MISIVEDILLLPFILIERKALLSLINGINHSSMVIDKEYLEKLSLKREKRCMMLSYRRYHLLGRLHQGSGQVIFDKYKSQYTPKVWAYALSLYFHSRTVEPFSTMYFRKAKKVEKLWDMVWLEQPYINISLTNDQIQKQLEFMGYVKYENFKTHSLYSYVSTNREINGHFYIHPRKYVTNIKSIKIRDSYPYIYDHENGWDGYALEGYTKILNNGTKI